MKTARIATVCQIDHYPTVKENTAHILDLLELAMGSKPDMVCLPECFNTVSVTSGHASEWAESMTGPTLKAVAEKAKKAKSYVICPIRVKDGSETRNSAIILGRDGKVVGRYDKMNPVVSETHGADFTVFEKGIHPGFDLPVFDLDFGRIGIQICFDIGFPQGWAELEQKGVKAVFWPSAYNGGFPLQAYAYLHHYYVISSVREDASKIVNPCGRILSETNRFQRVIVEDINLDYLVCHMDYHHDAMFDLMNQYSKSVKFEAHGDERCFLVESRDGSVTMEVLRKKMRMESIQEYHNRHRKAFSAMGQGQCPSSQNAPYLHRPKNQRRSHSLGSMG